MGKKDIRQKKRRITMNSKFLWAPALLLATLSEAGIVKNQYWVDNH